VAETLLETLPRCSFSLEASTVNPDGVWAACSWAFVRRPGTFISRSYSGDDLRAHIVVGCVDSRQHLRRNAAKKGRTPQATALRLAGYFCVLTTLPEALASDDVVLELYRIRWQIELFFKRCKGILHFDQLRAFEPGLVRTYCLAKLIEVALIQCLHEEAIAFSPWGVPRCRRVAA